MTRVDLALGWHLVLWRSHDLAWIVMLAGPADPGERRAWGRWKTTAARA